MWDTDTTWLSHRICFGGRHSESGSVIIDQECIILYAIARHKIRIFSIQPPHHDSQGIHSTDTFVWCPHWFVPMFPLEVNHQTTIVFEFVLKLSSHFELWSCSIQQTNKNDTTQTFGQWRQLGSRAKGDTIRLLKNIILLQCYHSSRAIKVESIRMIIQESSELVEQRECSSRVVPMIASAPVNHHQKDKQAKH